MSDYQKTYQAARSREWLVRIIGYLREHPCVDCGERDTRVLEFDHVRGEKEGNIADMVNKRLAWHRIEAEIAKCDVRCANCHRRRHYDESEWGTGRGLS